MEVIEKFICGKKKTSCGDGIFISKDFIAVIDGVTSKGIKKWNGKESDEYAKELIIDTLQQIPKDVSAIDLMNALNQSLYEAYKKEIIEDKLEEHLRVTIIIYSKYHQQIWSVGDCQCIINQEYHQPVKKVDKLISELKSYAIQALLKSGITEEQLKEQDISRDMILPFLKLQHYFENDKSEYGYTVLNGQELRENQIDIYTVKPGDRVILASDGYPKLFETLAETEDYLKKVIYEDPLCYKQNKSTKGVQNSGNGSYDDRSYVKFEVTK